MNISKHISHLLYTTNYVVIPDFGGFICQEFRAEVNEVTQMFVPPSKRVSFQPALLDHDDRLVRHVAAKEGLTRESAVSAIRVEISKWLLDLSEGKHIKLEGIGRIYKDQHGEYGFQAALNANYDTDSFGLGIFRFPALQEETEKRSVLKMASRSKSSSGFSVWKSAAVVAGVMGLLYLGTQKADFNTFEAASINPMIFSRSNPDLLSTQEEVSIESVATDTEETSVLKAEDLTVESTPPEAGSNESESPSVIPVDVDASSKPFHIIVGAFKVEENASKLQSKLVARGYQDAIYFYEKGLFRLSIQQFDQRNDAVYLLGDVKANVQKSAWIYSK